MVPDRSVGMCGEIVEELVASSHECFGAFGLTRSNGAESCSEGRVAGLTIPNKGADDVLDMFDLGGG